MDGIFLPSSAHIIIYFHQYDFQTYVSDKYQCFKSHAIHGMFDFAYKLQLHYNVYKLVFTITIWMVKIIKMRIH